jgi:non-heme chloroperoxidase
MNRKIIAALITFLCCLPIRQTFSQTPATSASIKSDFVTTRSGLRIHYLEAGRTTSSPAHVLIPGWRLPAFLWKEQLQKFSHTTRVIAIDPRSQGDSTITNDGNTPES